MCTFSVFPQYQATVKAAETLEPISFNTLICTWRTIVPEFLHGGPKLYTFSSVVKWDPGSPASLGPAAHHLTHSCTHLKLSYQMASPIKGWRKLSNSHAIATIWKHSKLHVHILISLRNAVRLWLKIIMVVKIIIDSWGCLLASRHNAKPSTYINTFNPHNTLRQVLLLKWKKMRHRGETCS